MAFFLRSMRPPQFCCEIDRVGPWQAVERLREHGTVATVTPYATSFVRFGPSIRNNPREVERVLRAMRRIA